MAAELAVPFRWGTGISACKSEASPGNIKKRAPASKGRGSSMHRKMLLNNQKLRAGERPAEKKIIGEVNNVRNIYHSIRIDISGLNGIRSGATDE